MNKLLAFLLLSMGVPALAATYTVAAGASAATIQATVNTAGAASGNTVAFAAGSYRLSATVYLPCANGTIYTGPIVGIVTQSHPATAVLTESSTTAYALQTNSNGAANTIPGQGCTIEYLGFSGTQGGIYVVAPSSGILIQYNYFTLNNPPVGGAQSQQAIYLDGDQNAGLDPSTGASYISILWNVIYNNCTLINAEGGGNGNVDSGGYCDATLVNAYNNHLVWNNNTVNTIEEGLKFAEQNGGLQQTSLNADVENNNLQGNSRIMIETQQDTNGVATYSHNAFYKPNNPNNYTFELSMPEYTPSTSPTHTADDNVFIGNVPVTGETGSGAHYGIGLELWGAGSVVTNNLFQGGNGAESCGAGYGCSGWGISVGEAFTNATITNNYFSGTDVWAGTANKVNDAITYEDGGSSSNPGITLSPNTVVQTSTTIATVAPTISVVAGSPSSTVKLADSDTAHRLSIFYTTDGTTPAPFVPDGSAGTTRVYSAPFTVSAGATVKAVSSWGQGANQGITFPSFGYVPSSVVTATNGVSSPAATGKTLVSAYLGNQPGANTMVTGGTLQFIAYGVYSDGSVSALPDALGNKVTLWNTSNHNVAKMSSLGHATAMGAGTVNIEATIGSVAANIWTVTVKAASTPAAATVAAPANTTPVTPAAAADSAPAAEAALVPNGEAVPALPPASAPSIPIAGPAPAAPGAPLKDNYLGPLWKLVTPAGGLASISDAHLFIGVPGGSNHDLSVPSNQAVRVVQAIGDENFDVAIKVDSPVVATDANTSQGLMVLADNEDFITFALTTDGTNVGLKAYTVTNGAVTTVLDDVNFSQYQNPMYLRLTRTSSTYMAYYSVDGANWTLATSLTNAKAPTLIGPFAGNYNSTPANTVPVVMSVNWFNTQ
jgi:Fn3 associated/Beta xylosidase C-terminal Concanavalin A-like domain